MTVADVLRTLRERWLVLVLAALLAGVAAFVYTRLPWVEPRWRSSVLIQATGRLDYGSFLALEKELRPLAEEVRQLSIMRAVDQDLHTDIPPDRLLDRTKAEPIVDSGQIRIDVEDPDPRRAEQLALDMADVYTRQHNAAEQGKLREERVILTTLDRPTTASLSWPVTRILVPAAALLGLVAAAAVVLVLEYFDDSLRTEEDVRQTLGLPILGSIPRGPRRAAGRLALGSARAAAVSNPSRPAAGAKKDQPVTP